MQNAPLIICCASVFVIGLMIGSFLNVLIARLPFEKSIIWPGSRCFSCFEPIGKFDNLPVIGYLLLGGRCRNCHAPFSSRYLWVELGTGVAFLGLFVLEVLVNPARLPNVQFQWQSQMWPPTPGLFLFGYHACLLSLLIAAAVIDAEHRIIPPLIPYTGALIGIVGGALMPWPWPHPLEATKSLLPGIPWILIEQQGKIPLGVQPWPFWGPVPAFVSPGTWQLGLLNALIGALAGSLVVRWVKWLFETGFGKDALGLGDADLLMMAGAFLGWQIAVLSLFVGAIAALVVFKLPGLVVAAVRKTAVERELPFGPGLALGVVVTWLGWPWIGPRMQFPLYDLTALGVIVVVLSVGMMAAGLLLRRGE
ncbi:MAG TPA: prepilin peptidase [Gemmataceae bacterium]|nr:prepilin peptidase [Gemmataceae bacterium]